MREWRKWFPKSIMVRDSDYDKTFDLLVRYDGQQTIWRIICKSYESKDTKWSGAAVTGVLLTEGVTEPTLNEIKQRFRNDSFGYWDYTPYEPRNLGSKSALAHRVFKGKVELPLSPFVFSGFGIEKTPDFILPTDKKDDMVRMWSNTPEGEARLHGKFYSSSPVVLTNLDTTFHTLPWSKEQLFEKFPDGSNIITDIAASSPHSHRVLHDVERSVINAEAYGYLIQLRELGIITEMEIEVVIDRIMMSGYMTVDLNELKSMVAQLMAENDDSFNTGSRTMLCGKDTIN